MPSKNRITVSPTSVDDLLGQFKSGLVPAKPWESIQDFVTHPSYMGYTPYPKQMTLLKLIYLETENMNSFDLETIEEWRQGFGKKESYGVQPDIWHRVDYLKKNGYRRFPHVQNVTGRRGSKGWIGGVLAAEQIAYMVSLDDWQKHYGVQANKACFISSIATNIEQAKKFQYADIREAVESCQYLKKYTNNVNEYTLSVYSPSDLRRIALDKARGVPERNVDRASIRAIAMPASSSSGRGGVGLGNFYDEFAFMLNTDGPASSEGVYSAYQPSLKQFGKDALTYIPSSPFTKTGKFYALYEQGSRLMPSYLESIGESVSEEEENQSNKLVAVDPRMLVYQNASWALFEDWEKAPKILGYSFPKALLEYDQELQIEERLNPGKFKVEYRGQFAEVDSPYLDPEKVDDMFRPFWQTAEDPKGRVLEPTPYGRLDIVYTSHMDPSKVNDNFAFAIGHLESSPVPDEYGNYWPHVIIDRLKVWKPSEFPDHTLDYVVITEELKGYLRKFPSLREFTADQYNSIGFFSELRKEFSPRVIFKEETATRQSNIRRTEQFKAALNLGWVHSFKDNFFRDNEGSLLEQELKFLSEKNGVADHQSTGPVTTKDLADAVMSVAVRLLSNNLDNYQSTLMSKLQPNFSQDQLVRVVDRVGTQASVRDRMNSLSSSLINRNQGYGNTRWSRK